MKLSTRLAYGILLLTLILSACSPAAPTAAPASPTQAEGSEPEKATEAAGSTDVLSGEPVTIRIWDFGGAEFDWIDSIAIPEFKKKYPNITVEHLGVPESDYSTKVDTAIAANDVPDIALQSYMFKLWKAGHVITLDSYMARDGIKPEDFFPIYQSWGMLDGKAYIMPVSTYVWGMVYHKDLFKAAGVPELTSDTVITFDQWLDYARELNKPAESLEDRVFGSTNFPPNWNAMNNYMSNPFILGPDGKNCKDNAATEDWIRTWTALTTAYNENLTVDSASGLVGDTSWDDLMQQGKLAMMPGNYGNALALQNAGVNVGLAGQPVVTPGWEGNAGAWMDAYGIMKGSEHPDEAWLFLKFLTTDVALLKANGECDSCGNAPSLISQAQEWAGSDPMRKDYFTLLNKVVPPPFSPDVWTSVDAFYEAFRMMTEDKADVKQTVMTTAEECQEKLDEQWQLFNELGQ